MPGVRGSEVWGVFESVVVGVAALKRLMEIVIAAADVARRGGAVTAASFSLRSTTINSISHDDSASLSVSFQSKRYFVCSSFLQSSLSYTPRTLRNASISLSSSGFSLSLLVPRSDASSIHHPVASHMPRDPHSVATRHIHEFLRCSPGHGVTSFST